MDSIDIDPQVISYKLNMNSVYSPVRQKRRKVALENKDAINDEIANLLAAGKIREVRYLE